MITLICGIPGHGKTLFAVSRIAEEAARENRPVYYYGIPDCKVPGWTALDEPKDWFKLPPRSIVVIDEAHQVFPQRGPSATVPEHVGMSAVLRRLGLDLVLITQDGNSLDHFIRRRCGRYLHIWRTMGMQRATVWEFPKWVDWEDEGKRRLAVRHQFSYPKQAFSLYKSAEVHTVKRRIPLKVLWFPLGGIALVALLVWGYKSLMGGSLENGKKAVESVAAKPGPTNQPVFPGQAPTASAPVKTAREFLTERIPRFQDFPESAPRFDAIAKPVSFPVVSACLAAGKRCSCYSQQGTKLPGVSEDFCRGFVRDGFFNVYESVGKARGDGGGVRPHAEPRTPPSASVGLEPPLWNAPGPTSPAEQGLGLSGERAGARAQRAPGR